MIFWFFGIPGSGKDYCARIMNRLFHIPHINADTFLTATDKRLLRGQTFTPDRRIKKLGRISAHINKLRGRHKNIAAADSLPDRRSRAYLRSRFRKSIVFVHVKTPARLQRQLLQERKHHFFKKKLLNAWISTHWEKIQEPHIVLRNTKNQNLLKKRISRIFKKYASAGQFTAVRKNGAIE